MGIPRRRRRGIGALIAASRQEEDKRGIGATISVGREAEDSDEETVVEAEVISSDDDSDQDAKLPAKEPDEAPDERVAYYEGVSLNRKVMRTNMRKAAAIAAGVHPPDHAGSQVQKPGYHKKGSDLWQQEEGLQAGQEIH